MSNLCPVKNFIRPDKPHGCTYLKPLETQSELPSPHHHVKKEERHSNTRCETILDMIGNTPLVHLKNLSQDYGIKCNLYAKCEYLNAGGSVKDRIGLRMIEEAEKAGQIKPGDYIIEPTSGNTGIGLALTCAVKGYKCIIVMPEKMSKEKNDVLKALGATIIRTPTSAAFDAPNSHISEAQRIKERLNAENPGCAHILDQYTNPYNPIAHYDGTAEEIINQLNGKVDLIVSAAGTGGTICGIARKIKEKCPDCKVIGVDPVGSILALPDQMNEFSGPGFYEVEGIGYDFIPTVLDRFHVDAWFKSIDKESFKLSRQLIKREGILCGGSSGSSTYCAIEAIKKYGLKEGQNAVIILPDSIRNYMTKFLSDEWMVARGFMEAPISDKDPWWTNQSVSEIKDFVKQVDEHIIDENVDCSKALQIMRTRSIDCLLQFQNGVLKNVITKKNMMNKLVNGSVRPSDLVSNTALDRFITLNSSDKLKRLQCTLDSEGYAVVTNKDGEIRKEDVFGIVNMDQFLEYISTNNNHL
ncbi:unnamed protein product [Brachionus calyciflorus]|uniref:Cystathionine beta-synthase n=1 Tax=Brachionus calyciflorus TaxID=104777 RepID=A0A813M2F8_9BILA|nr:unnamed protein product [Brachionus calyciflorus]